MVRRFVAAVVVVLGIGLAATASAETQSAKLFEEGRALAKEGKYEEACAKFAKSLELDRASGTLVNYADCHEHLGHLAQAWRLFDEAVRVSEQDDNPERAKFARERAQALVPRTGTIVVKLATPDVSGLTVEIDERTITPAAEIREVVDAGDVAIEVAAPGMQTFAKRERAEAGLRIVVEVPALAPMRPQDEEPAPASETRRRRTRVIAAYTLVGLGAASLGVGITLGFVGKSRYDQELENGMCSDGDPPTCTNAAAYQRQRDAITMANIGTGFAVAGLALVGAGAVVFLTAPRDVVVIPTATASSGGLAVVGRF
jgi:tetratricopeptide (TPR) repeat protein